MLWDPQVTPGHTILLAPIQTPSPIHTLLPIVNFQGYLILTLGFTTTPLPIFEPNALSRPVFKLLKGFKGLMKKIEFTKNQTPLLNIDAPGEYQSLLNLDKSTFSI